VCNSRMLGSAVATTLILLSVSGARGSGCEQAGEAQSQIGYKPAPDVEQKKTLLLKDFKPQSMMHAPAHNIDRAKYYVIDVHNHINDAQRIEEHMPPERVIEVMDKTKCQDGRDSHRYVG
jgi:hypothetical protein